MLHKFEIPDMLLHLKPAKFSGRMYKMSESMLSVQAPKLLYTFSRAPGVKKEQQQNRKPTNKHMSGGLTTNDNGRTADTDLMK